MSASKRVLDTGRFAKFGCSSKGLVYPLCGDDVGKFGFSVMYSTDKGKNISHEFISSEHSCWYNSLADALEGKRAFRTHIEDGLLAADFSLAADEPIIPMQPRKRVSRDDQLLLPIIAIALKPVTGTTPDKEERKILNWKQSKDADYREFRSYGNDMNIIEEEFIRMRKEIRQLQGKLDVREAEFNVLTSYADELFDKVPEQVAVQEVVEVDVCDSTETRDTDLESLVRYLNSQCNVLQTTVENQELIISSLKRSLRYYKKTKADVVETRDGVMKQRDYHFALSGSFNDICDCAIANIIGHYPHMAVHDFMNNPRMRSSIIMISNNIDFFEHFLINREYAESNSYSGSSKKERMVKYFFSVSRFIDALCVDSDKPSISIAGCERSRLQSFFNAPTLCHLIDSQFISLGTVNTFRQLQLVDIQNFGFSAAIIASSYSILQCRAMLASYGALVLGGTMQGEFGFSMDMDLVYREYLTAKYLCDGPNTWRNQYGYSQIPHPIADITVDLAFTLDGTNFGNIGIVLGGLKEVHTQSVNNSMVTHVFIGKDNKLNTFIYFKTLLEWVERTTGTVIAIAGVRFKSIFAIPADLKAQWAIYGSGSPCQCGLCGHRIKHATQKEPGCKHCKRRFGEGATCRHKEMEDVEEIIRDDFIPAPYNGMKYSEDKQACESFIERCQTHGYMRPSTNKTVAARQALLNAWHEKYYVVMAIDSPKNIMKASPEIIHANLKVRFKTSTDLLDAVDSHYQLMQEDLEDTIEVKELSLLVSLLAAETLLRQRRRTTSGNGIIKESRLLIICIVHLRLRTGEKLFRLLIVTLGSLNIRAYNFVDEKEQDRRFHALAEYVTNKILVSGSGIASHGIRLKREKKKLVPFSLDGKQLKLLFDHFEFILGNFIFVSEFEKSVECTEVPMSYSKWLQLITLYKSMLESVASTIHFPADKCHELQDSIDLMGDIFYDGFGEDEDTPYFHYLFSGHVRDLLLEHGCIARYCNQGWEKLNGVYKQAIAKLSNKGGGAGNANSYNRELSISTFPKREGYIEPIKCDTNYYSLTQFLAAYSIRRILFFFDRMGAADQTKSYRPFNVNSKLFQSCMEHTISTGRPKQKSIKLPVFTDDHGVLLTNTMSEEIEIDIDAELEFSEFM